MAATSSALKAGLSLKLTSSKPRGYFNILYTYSFFCGVFFLYWSIGKSVEGNLEAESLFTREVLVKTYMGAAKMERSTPHLTNQGMFMLVKEMFKI
jgi:hypothetical protein